MKLTVHHTCRKKGDIDKIKRAAPFYSDHNESAKEFKFLGSGYYFWDGNIGIAHWWGKKQYGGKYLIFEGTIDAKKRWFLDLVGNRKDLRWMGEMIEKLEAKHNKPFTLSEAIELLKKKGIFDYRLIRAADNHFIPKKTRRFIPTEKHYLNLNPVYIVCSIDKERDLLINFKLKRQN